MSKPVTDEQIRLAINGALIGCQSCSLDDDRDFKRVAQVVGVVVKELLALDRRSRQDQDRDL